jgi:penicillin-binding protein 1A
MSNALSSIVGPTINKIMEPIHKNIYQPDGTWKTGDWFTKPAGVQTLFVSGRNDLFPSWFNKNQQSAGKKMTFDKVSRKLASDCTPDAAKIEITVQSFTDPITKKTSYIATDGYDPSGTDESHKCDDVRPAITTISNSGKKITAEVAKGTFSLQTVEFKVDGESIGSVAASGSDTYSINYSGATGSHSVEVIVTDQGLYQGSSKRTLILVGGN